MRREVPRPGVAQHPATVLRLVAQPVRYPKESSVAIITQPVGQNPVNGHGEQYPPSLMAAFHEDLAAEQAEADELADRRADHAPASDGWPLGGRAA
jgi:hypothetical protein